MKLLLLFPVLLAAASAANNILYTPGFYPYNYSPFYLRALPYSSFPVYGAYPYGVPVPAEPEEPNKDEFETEESSRRRRDVLLPHSFSYPFPYAHPYSVVKYEEPKVEVKTVGNTILPYDSSSYSSFKQADEYPIFETAYPHYPVRLLPHAAPYYKVAEKKQEADIVEVEEAVEVAEPVEEAPEIEEPASKEAVEEEQPAAEVVKSEEPATEPKEMQEPALEPVKPEEPAAESKEVKEPAAESKEAKEPASEKAAKPEEPAAESKEKEEPATKERENRRKRQLAFGYPLFYSSPVVKPVKAEGKYEKAKTPAATTLVGIKEKEHSFRRIRYPLTSALFH